MPVNYTKKFDYIVNWNYDEKTKCILIPIQDATAHCIKLADCILRADFFSVQRLIGSKRAVEMLSPTALHSFFRLNTI